VSHPPDGDSHRNAPARLATGVSSALGAGLLWGLVFVAPAWLPDYPPAVLSVGRYLAFGLIALALAWPQRHALARLGRADWREAARLSLVGNLLYYTFLAAAIQQVGVPLPTMIIGTLPVVIAIAANLSDRALPWRRLLPSIAVIALGVGLVNHVEFARLALEGSEAGDANRVGLTASGGQVQGIALAFLAVACWTWYPIRNAKWLRIQPELSPSTWATAQGLMTLPLAAIGWVGLAGWYAWRDFETAFAAVEAPFAFPLGPDPVGFVALMLTLGLTASWLGTVLWNRASQLLPTSLAGQLIVFETLAAMFYAFLLRGQWPGAVTLLGVGLLVAGVVTGVRAAAGIVPAQSAPKMSRLGA
jgi:drug/metabolite transporter (DMT)-like permease